MSFLGVFHTSPGFADEIIHLFLARNLHWSPLRADEDEFIGLTILPWKQAVEMLIRARSGMPKLCSAFSSQPRC
jgi:ADP-ribose pyrophosphatase